jgi:phage protein U
MTSLIAYWGHEYFRVTQRFVFTFNNFERDSGGRYNYLERIGMKPMTDYAGPGLDQITFTAILEKSLGLNPRSVVGWWNRLSNSGKADVLVVGNKMVGQNNWLLKSVKEHWNTIDGKGNVLSGTMDLTFEEYMDT